MSDVSHYDCISRSAVPPQLNWNSIDVQAISEYLAIHLNSLYRSTPHSLQSQYNIFESSLVSSYLCLGANHECTKLLKRTRKEYERRFASDPTGSLVAAYV
eukprot:GHVN01030664.1.p1 GENE.GHVN01030664.1~~GHVN01030664.1.p1  ORF type:complete len:101 (+),score=6.61 GHVN01030664.1:114-416(+)